MSFDTTHAYSQSSITFEEAEEGLNLPSTVVSTASMLYELAEEENLARGRYATRSLGAAFYLSSRIHSHPLSPHEVASLLEIPESKLLKSARHITKELSLAIPPAEPGTFVDKYCDTLGLSDKTRDIAHQILEASKSSNGGGSPTGIAASAVYGASTVTGQILTQDETATVAGISPVTIRSRYKKQLEFYNVA